MSYGKIELKIDNATIEQTKKYQEIISILISSGALNLKNGKAILNFDSTGEFQGVYLEYWAFKRRKLDKPI